MIIVLKALFIYALVFIVMYAVTFVWVRFTKKKDYRKDSSGGIISANDNLAKMSWAEMIQYDFDRNIPYLVTNFGGIIINGFYTIGHTIVRTLWYIIQLLGLAGVLVYRSIIVPLNARKSIKQYMRKANKVKRKK